jgi:AcrR family transcriptional regulator
MSENREHDTEQRIFDAAREVFLEQGFDGARMAEIARRAGINQSMLHYYFRSKEKLFRVVFEKVVTEAIPPVLALLVSDEPVVDRLERFIEAHIKEVSSNPALQAFILQELRRNPDQLRRFVGSNMGNVFERLKTDIDAAAEHGEIRRVDPRHLLANMLALSVFPFVARPMLQTAFRASDDEYESFLSERGDEIVQFIRSALRP